ncbi:autotransporter (plasmid) [Fusobacterium varium]|nr:autotransporter [Fusobacterium varium]
MVGKKILLLVLFLIVLTKINANLEITENFINNNFITYKNNKENEMNVIVKGENIIAINNGIISVNYTEKDIIDFSSLQNKGNGITVNRSSLFNNNGVIIGSIITPKYITNSANGVSGKVGVNKGIISGNAVLIAETTTVNTIDSVNGITGSLDINNGIILGNAILTAGNIYITSNSASHVHTNANVTTSINGVNGRVGVNDGLIIGNASLKSGSAIAIVGIKASANANASSNTFDSVNGVYGEVGVNNGLIVGSSIFMGGKTIATGSFNTHSDSIAYAINSANGIYGNVGINFGSILGNSILRGGDASVNNKDSTSYAYAYTDTNTTSNGIYGKIKINNGLISGYIDANSGISENNGIKYKDYEDTNFSGNGIAINGNISSDIVNKGIIKGSQSAIAAKSILGVANNYGIMAGREIFSDGMELLKHENKENFKIDKVLDILIITNEKNYGTYINILEDSSNRLKVALDTEGDIIIEDIITATNLNNTDLGTNIFEKIILNAIVTNIAQVEKPSEGSNIKNIIGKDSYITIDSDKSYSDHIINGAGIKNAVLTVEENVTMDLKDSIVNGYKTAVSLNNNSIVTASDTIFNGGGLKNEDAVINIKGNNAALTIDGKSVINGLTTISGKDSIVNIGNEVMVNGNIKSEKDKNNILNLGDGTQGGELRLFHEIDGFTTINISGKVTAYETAKISSGDIHIKDGSLLVRLDGTQVDDQGRIKGHALYDHKGKVTAELSKLNKSLIYIKLVFKASGLGVGTIIAMNGTDITNLYDLQIGTHSSVHTAIKHQIDGELTGDVEIAVKTWDDLFPEIPVIPEEPEIPTIPETPGGTENPGTPEVPKNNEIKDKDELGEIYDSIVKGDQLPILGLTTDLEDKTKEESLKELVSLLDQIYANNPYSYGGEMSYESLRLFTDNILKTKMPELSEWIVESHGIYGYDKFDKVRREHKVAGEKLNINYSRELTTTGLLGTAEYGIAQNSSLGVAVGGTKQKLNMHLSDVKGNLGYVGIYGKRRYENFLLTGGLGYQYGEYDVKRVIENNYQRINTSGEMKTNSMSGYIEGKYTIEAERGTKIEPKVKVTYSYIKQDKVKEKTGSLSIDMDKKSYLVPEMEVGVDISKEIKTKSGKVNTTAGISYVRVLGKDNTKLTGRMKDSTDFKVKGPNFKESKLRLEGRVEYEQENGIFYSASLGMDIGNKKEKEVNARVGIGYRF